MQYLHSNWCVSLVAITILSGLRSRFFIDPYQAFNRAVAYLVKDDSVLCVAVNIGHVDTRRLAHT